MILNLSYNLGMHLHRYMDICTHKSLFIYGIHLFIYRQLDYLLKHIGKDILNFFQRLEVPNLSFVLKSHGC